MSARSSVLALVVGGTACLALAFGSAAPACAGFRDPDSGVRETGLGETVESRSPEVCAGAPGVAYVAWIDYADGILDVGNVWFQRTTNGGAGWSGARRLNFGTPPGMATIAADSVRIACDGAGRVAVLWVEQRLEATEVYAVTSRDAGVSWDRRPARLGTDRPRGIENGTVPAVCTDGAGVFYAVWRAGDGAIKGNASTDAGLSWGAATMMGGDPESDVADAPDLACRPGGHAYVAWHGYDWGLSRNKVSVSSTGDSGASWAAPIRMDDNAQGGAQRPSIAADATGAVYVAWEDLDASWRPHVFMASSEDDGSTWIPPVRVDHQPAASLNEKPMLAVGPDGTVGIAWNGNDYYAAHVRFNRSTDRGVTWATSDTVIDLGPVGGVLADVASRGSEWLVSWFDSRQTWEGGPLVMLRHSHDAGATWLGEVDVDGMLTHTPATDLHVAGDGAGNWYASWRDIRFDRARGLYDIYANRSNDNGTSWGAEPVRIDTAPGQSVTGAAATSFVVSDNGRTYAAWADMREYGYSTNNADVYFNRSVNYGEGWDPRDRRLNTHAGPGQVETKQPTVVSDGTQFVAVAWIDGGSTIRFTRSDSGGSQWLDSPVLASRPAEDPGEEEMPGPIQSFDMKYFGGGKVGVLWAEGRNGNTPRIYFNLWDESVRDFLATDILVSETGFAPDDGALPRLAIDGAGRVYAAWVGLLERPPWPFRTVMINRSEDGGLTWASSTWIAHGNGAPMQPSLAATASGAVYVAWSARHLASEEPPVRAYDVFLNRSTDSGATWWPHEARLDTGDDPGSHASLLPQLVAENQDVIVAFVDDRGGTDGIWANASGDGGASWWPAARRLDARRPPLDHNAALGGSQSLALLNGRARVAWVDDRYGKYDVFVNTSDDGGATWRDDAVRVEAGDAAGASDASHAMVSVLGDGRTVAMWIDHRGGDHRLRTNSSELGCLGGPGEARDLRLFDPTWIGWNPPGGEPADLFTYDVIRSGAASDFGDAATCVASDVAGLLLDDAEAPGQGEAFYYLVRAQNACGAGALGRDSAGVEIAGRDCP